MKHARSILTIILQALFIAALIASYFLGVLHTFGFIILSIIFFRQYKDSLMWYHTEPIDQGFSEKLGLACCLINFIGVTILAIASIIKMH